MQLSDLDIKQALVSQSITIENFDEQRLQPAGYDVLLGFDFLTFNKHKISCIDPRTSVKDAMQKITVNSSDDCFVLHPGEFVLGVTLDRIGVDQSHVCQIMGKNSLARLGLIIHTTAGFIDPGNTLNITLEFVNVNTVPIKLYPMMKIAQVAFFELKTKSEKAYGDASLNSKYFGARTVEESQMYKNFDLQKNIVEYNEKQKAKKELTIPETNSVNSSKNSPPKDNQTTQVPNESQNSSENPAPSEKETQTQDSKKEKTIAPKPAKQPEITEQGELF